MVAYALSQTAPTGTGLTGFYYTNASSTYTNAVNFHPTNLFLTTNDSFIDFTWGPTNTPNLSDGNYTVRWTGQVEPQYSETYFFQTRQQQRHVIVPEWVRQPDAKRDDVKKGRIGDR